MSDNEHEHGPTNDQKMVASEVNLPDEIFEHHIWKHFSFHRWIKVFSLVSKRWKQICEESTVDPKQIHIDYKTPDIGRCIQVVKKYQPTILRIKLLFTNDMFLVHRLCEASKRLHTLVLECPYSFDMYIKPINNITTLAVKVDASKNFWQNLQIIFPNLKRLQIEQPNHPFNIKVDHLTLIHKDNSSLEQFKELNPDVIVTRSDKMIRTKLVGSDSTNSRVLTYQEYFRYFGETELLTAVKYRNITRAEQLLKYRQTTMNHEKDIYDSRDLYYTYPSAISTPLFDSKAYWSNILTIAYDVLLKRKLIPAPSAEIFIALSGAERKKEALKELAKLELASLTDDEYTRVSRAFFHDLLPRATKAELRQQRVIENVKMIVQLATIEGIEEKDFKKIADLRDWSNHFAITTDAKICYAMVDTGCKISSDDFKRLAEKKDVGFIIDLIVKKHPSKLFDALVYYPHRALKHVINKHNISLTMEKNGESLFNMRIREYVSKEEELTDYKHMVNHMDSKGNTPLSVALRLSHNLSSRIWPLVKKLLELGADPTKHRGDKLSPLGILINCYNDVRICYSGLELCHVINIINQLVEYGADVNAPCLFKERMCSPLMIAVQNYSANENVLSLLVALGARMDYCDETGRSVMDCIRSEYVKQHMNNLSKLYK